MSLIGLINGQKIEYGSIKYCSINSVLKLLEIFINGKNIEIISSFLWIPKPQKTLKLSVQITDKVTFRKYLFTLSHEPSSIF